LRAKGAIRFFLPFTGGGARADKGAMRCHAPQAQAARPAAAPAVQAKPDPRRALDPAGASAGFSLADAPIQAPPAGTGLPERLRAGFERLSGLAMDDVRVHRDSPEPARLGALAFAYGSDIHLGPGQERHLPHEAWHVVQQKQGRVAAAGRLGNVALNEDPALEAEADRMGAASHAPGEPAADLRLAPPRAGTVQRKAWNEVTPLDASQPMSEVLRQYVTSGVTYFLGKDSAADLMKLPVHLIDGRIKYLLGEQHDTAKWDAETKQWPLIPKMMEQAKGIPHEKDDTTGRLDVLTKPLALENRHAYLLTVLLDALEYMNKLNAEFAAGANRQTVTLVRDYADGLDRALGEIQKSVGGYEEWAARYGVVAQRGFAAKYDPKLHGASARLTQIKTFADNFSRAWGASLNATMSATQKLSQSMSDLDRSNTRYLLDADAAAARLDVAEVARGNAAISALATELTGIVGIPNAKDDKAVRDFAKSSARDAPQPVKDALNLERERGMIANIDGAAPPLLVRIGNFHVQQVAAAAKQPVQAIDKTDSLARFTGRMTFDEKK
jgi:hypothetical protein